MPFAFFQDFVGPAFVFVFDVQDGINDVFPLERPEAILPADAGEDGAVAKGNLAIEIQFGGPPSRDAVFKLRPKGVEVVAATLCAER